MQRRFLASSLAIALLLVALPASAQDGGACLNISPWGDSITQGGYSTSPLGAWRRPLHDKLQAAGVCFHFVGVNTSKDPPDEPHHNGIGGITSMQWANTVDYSSSWGFPAWLENTRVDVAAIELGTNDLLLNWWSATAGAIARLSLAILQANPSAKIILIAIPTTAGGKFQPRAVTINATLPHVADFLRSLGFDAVFVDPQLQPSDLVDGTHPNASGNEKIAQAVFCEIPGGPACTAVDAGDLPDAAEPLYFPDLAVAAVDAPDMAAAMPEPCPAAPAGGCSFAGDPWASSSMCVVLLLLLITLRQRRFIT